MLTRRSLMAGAAAFTAAQGATPQPFVRVDGTRLSRRGRSYRFVGSNLWYGAYLGAENPDRLRRELDTLRGLGIVNLRILGAAETSPLKNSLRVTTHGAQPPHNEKLLAGLDLCLAEMAKREMTAVIFLNNFWEWSGGMVTYQYWTNGGRYIDLGDPAHPWPEFADFSAQFYSSPKAIALYEQYVASIVGRINTVTGIAYRNDPAIMSWQLANEPRPGGSLAKTNFEAFYAWIARTADFIKKRDPNHLVSTGNEGVKGCLESEDCVLRANKPAGVDYITFHLWPLNWGWVDVANIASTYEACAAKSRDYIATHVKLAQKLGKPLVLEEFGFVRDSGLYAPTVPTVYRDRFYRLVFEMVEASVKSGGPFVGSNFWSWGGEGRAQHPDATMREGDTAYVGDPPMEPQGRNSVFNSDTATLALIRTHATALRG